MHRAPVEAEQPGVHRMHVDAKGAAGLEAGHITVLFARAQIHFNHRLAVVGEEVAVNLLGVLQIGVPPVTAEDARGDAVALEQAAAQPAAAGPIVDRQDPSALDLVAADDPLVGVPRSRPDSEDTHPIALILGPVTIVDGLLERIEADQILISVRVGVTGPDGVRFQRLQTRADLSPGMVEDQHGVLRRLPAQANEIRADTVHDVGAATEAGDVEAFPGWGVTAKY